MIRSVESTISVTIKADNGMWVSPVSARHLGDTEWQLYDGLTRCYVGPLLGLKEAFDAVYNHAVEHLPEDYKR